MDEVGHLKLVIVGNSGVGKTALLERHAHHTFRQINVNPTVGIDMLTLNYNIVNDPDRRYVVVHYWDTAGQERFRSVVRGFYARAHAYIIVIDALVDSYEAQRQFQFWLEEVCANRSYNDAVVVCARNKCDLLLPNVAPSDIITADNERVVNTSALNGEGVDTLFSAAIDAVLAQPGLWMGTSSQDNTAIKLSREQRDATTLARCCH